MKSTLNCKAWVLPKFVGFSEKKNQVQEAFVFFATFVFFFQNVPEDRCLSVNPICSGETKGIQHMVVLSADRLHEAVPVFTLGE